MPEKNIFNRIHEVYDSLTKSSQKVADFIMAHPSEAQFMSITNMADACQVSEASITRFSKQLGCVGYNELKLYIAISLTENHVLPNKRERQPSDFSHFLKSKYDSHLKAIQETIERIDESSLTKAVALLKNAERVFCLGQGASQIMAMDAWSRFMTISNKFYSIFDSHLQAISLALADKNDVILFISYSGSTKEIVDTFKIARKNHIKIILVTNFEKSPGAALADIVLLCGSSETPLEGGSMEAKVAILFLLDLLFQGYVEENSEEANKNREITSEALTCKHL